MGASNEYSLVTLTATMHHFVSEQWAIQGQARLGIYHDTNSNTFRIVGRKLDDYEVVANCAINDAFYYNRATPSFHQWRDITHAVFGIKFNSPEDANMFGDTIERIVDSFDKVYRLTSSLSSSHLHADTQSLHSTGTMETNSSAEDCASDIASSSASYHDKYQNELDNVNQSPQLGSFPQNVKAPRPIPPPPPPPTQGSKPVPSTKPKPPVRINGNGQPGKTSNGSANNSTLLDEMAQTLAKRRAKIEESLEKNHSSSQSNNYSTHLSVVSPSSHSKSFTPVNGFKNDKVLNRMNSKGDMSASVPPTGQNETCNGKSPSSPVLSPLQANRLKEEILTELRQELVQFKQDILNAIRTEITTHLR